MILLAQWGTDTGGQDVKKRVKIITNNSRLGKRLGALCHGHHLE